MDKIQKTEEESFDKTQDEWKKILSPEEYKVLREKGTEPPFVGKYVNMHEDGAYHCRACGAPLFSSDTKFDSGTGWPSFYDLMHNGAVELKEDDSLGMPASPSLGGKRTEVNCARCGSHLGHLFDDGPEDKGGKRYCINSCSLNFKSAPAETPEKK
ncbi:peptide-methionine (R)-S-oxide reductase [Candidatus Giovannonibacteria bacterium RIFCSPHIGHO2_01_FULL_45_33]|uniref:peptide-methionine (R)-S-oxide reductase n=1 Tax=Candidatus Giovannonibacteria bacterium RIFCSPLOWO2_01_FULL_45_34 TaxID=1798351 RepID=A0A1F5X217_9BACT|nr:MAG: peptide-methionine (R)-S-oxide reductase [Candidatus Giovannonibacteria bacterium RIFCSPHIGHO2_01_FULL_45_33]OGF69130.1 MAG: peptide-methionine (R)-S-oxide reductase [Candidatus Giovannonibacteria bacterium RIFCSPHIGHO2_02_FULL_44_11]OGF81939.1 MAG: peptide-methionine (R)-S-oxide reductase [Candidatus Giovannonibacteria bacterium RIFCSPLOWO2_01_FULL_45_34]